MRTEKHEIKLYDYKGCINCFGNKNIEDRYIIIDKKGMDIIGENFTKKEAEQLCNELNNDNILETFLKELLKNVSVLELSKYFNKNINEVCSAIEKFIVILYFKNGSIKEIKIDFLETKSNIKIKQKYKL